MSSATTDLPPPASIPRHIAIIMDGNGRWARERGKPRIAGHEAGAQAVRQVAEACAEAGVEFLTLYAFSYENWQRPPSEVAALMELLEHFLQSKADELHEKNIRLQAIGRLHDLPAHTRRALDEVIERTAGNTGLTIVFALSYSARLEIVDGVKSVLAAVAAGKLDPETLDPEIFARHLYPAAYPDPDLLIRTSGEMRISNFLLWQISYSEMYLTKKLWPDFGREDLFEAVRDFSRRQRRFGAV